MASVVEKPALLELRNLACGYGERPVLDNISLSVHEGEAVLLAGPNGCGKSTLLKAVVGALPLTDGSVSFGGEPLAGKAVVGALPLTDGSVSFGGEPLAGKSIEERIRLGIGYLRQTDNIFPSQTVEENLALAGMSLPKAAYATARTSMLELFDFLKPALDQRAGSLSGGQRQALALAMVFLRPQRLFLLDEPTAGLSPKAAQDIMERIRRFAKDDSKRAILMVEHRLDLLPWIDRAVFLSQGRIKSETSDPKQFLDTEWLAKNYFE